MGERQAKLGRADERLTTAERLAMEALEDLRETEPDSCQQLGQVLVELKEVKLRVRESKKWPAPTN